MKLKYLFSITMFFLVLPGFSQDLLIKVNKDTITCYVKEIGDDEIKYTLPENREDLLFGIDKNKVAAILFKDGKKIEFANSMTDPKQYENQRKNALKIGFLSPLFQATNFSFEHSLGAGKSIEATIGIIGLGMDVDNTNAQGAYFKLGYKFIKDPDFYLKGMRYAHILKGSYFKPEIAFTTYKRDNGDSYSYNGDDIYVGGVILTEEATMFAFILNIGKQWVFQDRFLIDWYGGVGYGFGSNDDNSSNHYAFVGADNEMPLVFTAGLKVGILIK